MSLTGFQDEKLLKKHIDSNNQKLDGKACPFYIGIEEGKPASKSSNRSDTAIVALYAIGVIAAVGVSGMMIRNRIHKSN